MEFSSQEYWNGLPFPSPGDLPDSGIEPGSHVLQAGSLSAELQGKPLVEVIFFLPPLAITKTYNLIEPEDMGRRSTNSATFLLQIILLLFGFLSSVYFCDSMDCSPPGSSVHGISQAGILEWVAISPSRGSSPPRDRTQISCIGRRIHYH